MKRRYDLRMRPQQFLRGQWVLYYSPRKFQGRQQKWQTKFSPHMIIKELSPVKYMIQKTKRSHPFIAHVNKLKLYGGHLPKSWLTDADDVQTRAVRRRRRAADILLTPPPPIVTDRRAAAAAADRMSASRRRRFRDVFTS